MKGFKVCKDRGFHIEFPNGVVLSTQIGPGSYSANRDESFETEPRNGVRECFNCEVAIWRGRGMDNWLTGRCFKDLTEIGCCSSDGQVAGWVQMEDWLKIFNWCQGYKEAPND